MSLKITGLDEVQNRFKKIADAAEDINGEHQVPISELLTEGFIKANTNLDNIDALFSGNGFNIASSEDLKAIPEQKWDSYIASVSTFNSWREMLQAAGAEYVKRKLGL